MTLFNQDWDLKFGGACPYIIKDMKNRWFISDTHWFQENILKFKRADGTPLRPFKTIQEMNEIMAERWNGVVRPGDSVKHLGDVALGLKGDEYTTKLDPYLSRLHGRKDLIIGNHDDVKQPVLQKHFRKMNLWKHYHKDVWGVGFYLSHFPLRLDQLRKAQIQIHGHIHEKIIDDLRYICICCERTNYAPVHLDEIISEIRKRGLI